MRMLWLLMLLLLMLMMMMSNLTVKGVRDERRKRAKI